MKRIRRKAKVNARVCQAALVDGLDGNEAAQCIATITLSNAIYSFTSRAVLKKTMNMVDGGLVYMTEEAAIEALARRSSGDVR